MPPFSKTFDSILALSHNFGIGKNGSLPWRIRRDLKMFQNITTNLNQQGQLRSQNSQPFQNVVIMGRKTYESIGTPLPNRQNIVVSSKPSNIQQNEVEYSKDYESALSRGFEKAGDLGRVFIIGGSQLYQQAAVDKRCSNVFLTRIGNKVDCDVTLPQNIFNQFIATEPTQSYAQNDFNFDFQILTRPEFKDRISGLRQQIYGQDLIRHIIQKGNQKSDRTGTGTKSIFGHQMRYDLSQTFPLLTTKDVFFRGVVEELLWFIKGQTNSKILDQKGVKIWNDNGSRQFLDANNLSHREEGDLGPIYGFQWRHYNAPYKTMHDNYDNQGVDQLQQVIHQIKTTPHSRRIIMTAWNPCQIPEMALPPCHVMVQFYVNDNKLSSIMYQRSCDVGLGVPFNIASYALLTKLIAIECNMEAGEFIHMMGDTHVYNNHISALEEQLTRVPKTFPVLKIEKKNKLEDYDIKDFKLIGYNPDKKIKMKMAV